MQMKSLGRVATRTEANFINPQQIVDAMPTEKLQAIVLARRLGLTPSVAAAVAALVFPEGRS